MTTCQNFYKGLKNSIKIHKNKFTVKLLITSELRFIQGLNLILMAYFMKNELYKT
ncbi:hypothetical protein MSHRCOH1_07555 [Candidatus Ornithobacterium hominis]|nr:hypothetical protein MSHRCOH1_07555 [Candidatus Ornithobacterium hominis]